ncbi:hypothetical protein DICA4_F00760 [Diutina catenulata]
MTAMHHVDSTDPGQQTHYVVKKKPRRAVTGWAGAEMPLVPGNPFVPLFGGHEPQHNTELRHQLYEKLWKQQHDKIERILGDVNTELYGQLARFVRQAAPGGKVPVAMLKLSTNTANNARILDEFRQQLAEKTVVLTSKYFSNIKMVCRELIRQVLDVSYQQFEGLEAEDTLPGGGAEGTEDVGGAEGSDGTPGVSDSADGADGADGADANGADDAMDVDNGFKTEPKSERATPDLGDHDITKGRLNFDVDILRDWQARAQAPAIVVIIQDTNKVDKDVLNELLLVAHSLGLPFRFVMGVSSSNTARWVNDSITPDNRDLIACYVFEGMDNTGLGYRILEHLFLQQPDFLLDSKLSTILLHRFDNANNSVDALISSIKLCYMVHFYQSPLSVYVDHVEESPMYLDALRKLPSFKKYVETTLDTSVINDDATLVYRFGEAREEFEEYKRVILSVIETLHRLSQPVHPISKFELYHMVVNGRYIISSHVRKLVAAIDSESPAGRELVDTLKLSVRPIDQLLFHEIFTLNGGAVWQHTELVENFTNLSLQLVRPSLRRTLEQALEDSSLYLGDATPMVVRLFKIYKEAPVSINIYDFYTTFRHSLNRREFDVPEGEWDQTTYAWFIHACFVLITMGFLKEKPKGDYLEKALWVGI